ncbi:hypothetical protein ACQJBY_002346 [Aegilops geniculata]
MGAGIILLATPRRRRWGCSNRGGRRRAGIILLATPRRGSWGCSNRGGNLRAGIILLATIVATSVVRACVAALQAAVVDGWLLAVMIGGDNEQKEIGKERAEGKTTRS